MQFHIGQPCIYILLSDFQIITAWSSVLIPRLANELIEYSMVTISYDTNFYCPAWKLLLQVYCSVIFRDLSQFYSRVRQTNWRGTSSNKLADSTIWNVFVFNYIIFWRMHIASGKYIISQMKLVNFPKKLFLMGQ